MAGAVADRSSPLLKRLLPRAAVGEEVLCEQLTLPHSRAVRQQRMRNLSLSESIDHSNTSVGEMWSGNYTGHHSDPFTPLAAMMCTKNHLHQELPLNNLSDFARAARCWYVQSCRPLCCGLVKKDFRRKEVPLFFGLFVILKHSDLELNSSCHGFSKIITFMSKLWFPWNFQHLFCLLLLIVWMHVCLEVNCLEVYSYLSACG